MIGEMSSISGKGKLGSRNFYIAAFGDGLEFSLHTSRLNYWRVWEMGGGDCEMLIIMILIKHNKRN